MSFLVDTNCVNSRQKIIDLNILERWAVNEVIGLLTTEIARLEMLAGNDKVRREKAYNYVSTYSEILETHERDTLNKIENILFPVGAKNKNQQNDVEIVFNAGKYHKPLITNDGGSKSQPGGILGNKKSLLSLGIKVISPSEAVSIVRSEIYKRDEYAKQYSEFYKTELPIWVGQD